ncbi:hypothetical protein BAPNAU_2980 [Bacillus velezensis NAU-B3]|nr:hypothetical protein BAPNAU_2980 [Bacillus velezensis NAU-B3]
MTLISSKLKTLSIVQDSLLDKPDVKRSSLRTYIYNCL